MLPDVVVMMMMKKADDELGQQWETIFSSPLAAQLVFGVVSSDCYHHYLLHEAAAVFPPISRVVFASTVSVVSEVFFYCYGTDEREETYNQTSLFIALSS